MINTEDALRRECAVCRKVLCFAQIDRGRYRFTPAVQDRKIIFKVHQSVQRVEPKNTNKPKPDAHAPFVFTISFTVKGNLMSGFVAGNFIQTH